MRLSTTLLATLLSAPLLADTVYTIPQGYTRVTFPAASGGTPTLTAMSATLLNDLAYSGTASVGAFNSDPDSNPLTTEASQAISATGATWTTDQFTAAPHLAYLVNANGSEEAFLITSHTANTLSLDVSFNILDGSRFNAATTIKIRPANTVGSILGTTTTPFTINDRAFLWDGSGWETLVAANNQWFFVGGSGSATDAVVFPEEGIFVQRAEATDAVITIFGEVPTANQASSIAGASSHFVSTRFPVGDSTGSIRLADLNIDEIPGWTSSDRAYFWTGSEWQTLVSVGADWRFIGGSTPGDLANDLLIAPNSALFLTRNTTGTASASPLVVPLPYTITLSE